APSRSCLPIWRAAPAYSSRARTRTVRRWRAITRCSETRSRRTAGSCSRRSGTRCTPPSPAPGTPWAPPWPGRRPSPGGRGAGAVRARVGLRSGAVEVQGAPYFGAGLYRCARLTEVAHGGQVVVSGATAELARDALPAGTARRDLGPHRLRDLQLPERVSQLV